jgi:hypothetical protein
METTIVLTMKEQKRVEVIQRVFRRELTMAEAAMVLGVCERQSYRHIRKLKRSGKLVTVTAEQLRKLLA